MKIRNIVMAVLLVLLSGTQQSAAMQDVAIEQSLNAFVVFIVTNFEKRIKFLEKIVNNLDEHSVLFKDALHICIFFQCFYVADFDHRIRQLQTMRKKAPVIYQSLMSAIKKRQEIEETRSEAGESIISPITPPISPRERVVAFLPEPVQYSRLQALLEAVNEEARKQEEGLAYFRRLCADRKVVEENSTGELK